MESLVNEIASGSTACLLRELTQVKQDSDQLAKALDHMASIIASSRASQPPDASAFIQKGRKDRAVGQQDAANIALSRNPNWLLNNDNANAFDNDRGLEPAPRTILPQSIDC